MNKVRRPEQAIRDDLLIAVARCMLTFGDQSDEGSESRYWDEGESISDYGFETRDVYKLLAEWDDLMLFKERT